MSYIKREPLLEIAKRLQGGMFGAPLIVREIKNAPPSDVVEVVRCRDCIHNRDNGGDCDRTIILNEYDSTEYRCAGLEFCSYGERRTN